jgi:hypothetical protein
VSENDTPIGQRFDRASLHHDDVARWPAYRKHALTRAIKIAGPFFVDTIEGPLFCEDGYLAIDARGYPYPIATDEFELIYEPAREA